MAYTKDEGAVIRKLSVTESASVHCQSKFGINVCVESIHIRSAKPLKDEHMIKALNILQRKLQHLRTYVIEEEGQKYFKEMTPPTIDYARIEQVEWKRVHDEYLDTKYNISVGPLWRCRLIVPDKKNSLNELDVKSTKPEPYIIIFSHHHVIIDGVTTMQTYGNFFRILNNVIEGKELIEEGKNMAPSLESVVWHQLWLGPTDIFMAWRFLRSHFYPKPNYFTRKFASPTDVRARTKMLFMPIDRETSSKFIKKCKSAGATFHGAFTLLAALAMRDIVEGTQNCENDVQFQLFHAVDTRKFHDGDMSEIYGHYSSPLVEDLILPRDTREYFWKFAKEETQNIHRNIKDKTLQGERFLYHAVKSPERCMQEYVKHGLCEFEFGVTNMGNIDRYFNYSCEEVEPVGVTRSTAAHNLCIMVVHTLQTIGGLITYSLDYMTNYISEEHAKQYAQRTIETLIEVSNS